MTPDLSEERLFFLSFLFLFCLKAVFLVLASWPLPSVLSDGRPVNLSLMQFNSSWDCVNLQSSQVYFFFMCFVVISYLPCPLSPLLHLCFLIFCMICSPPIGLSPWILSYSVLTEFFWSLYLLVCLLCAISLFLFAEKSINHSPVRYLKHVVKCKALLKHLVCLSRFCKQRNLSTAQALWIKLSSTNRLGSCFHLPQIFPQGGWISCQSPCSAPFVLLLHNRLLPLHLQKKKLTLDGCFHTLAWNLNPI